MGSDRAHRRAGGKGSGGVPQALLLDFGGTLDADGVPWSARFFEAYRAAGGPVAREPFERLFAQTDAALLADATVRALGYAALVHRQADMLASILPGGMAARAVAERFLAEAVATVGSNRPVLERLARRMPLAVVSNFCGNLAPCLDELGLLPLLVLVLDSADVGISKPDRRIFEQALRTLDVPAAAAWFVGDNPYADVAPALALGMSACWLAPAERQAPEGIEPSVRIQRFVEIEQVLG